MFLELGNRYYNGSSICKQSGKLIVEVRGAVSMEEALSGLALQSHSCLQKIGGNSERG